MGQELQRLCNQRWSSAEFGVEAKPPLRSPRGVMGWGGMAQRGHAGPKLNLTQYLQVLLVLADTLPALPSVPEGAENGTRMALYTLGFPVSGQGCGYMVSCLLYSPKSCSQHPAQIFQRYYIHFSFSLDYFDFPSHIQPHEKKEKKKKAPCSPKGLICLKNWVAMGVHCWIYGCGGNAQGLPCALIA